MAASPLPGSILGGRYEILREVGRGGMATVFEANDARHGRRVAIKLLRQDVSVALGAQRFLREIGIAAKLSHPHIVPLIDSGEVDGALFFVAQFVPGGSLRERLLRETQVPLTDALRVTREIGSALDFAHRSGIVHRDVKPENVLFLDGHAMLTDFGIARACASGGKEALTEIGLVVGTPQYMSPEQASGEQDLQSASDQYSLACVLYEMLAGAPPLGDGTTRVTMARLFMEAPTPVRTRRPDAPLFVERALARALAKDPADRFESIAAFLQALSGEGVAADSSPIRSRAVAVLPFVNASPDPDAEYLSDGITDELIDALSRVKGLRVTSRTSAYALKGKPQDVRAIGAMLGVSEILEGTVRTSGTRLRVTVQLTCTTDGRLLWSQRYDRELHDVFAIQDEVARTIVNTLRATSFADLSEPLPRRYTENLTAYNLYLRGRFAWNKRTQEGTAEGIRYFEEAIAADPEYAPAYAGLSDSWALHVDYRSVPVAEGYGRAREYAMKSIALDDSLAEAHASLAWSLFIFDWDWSSAEREYQRAIALDPDYASAHQWRGMLLVALGRFREGNESTRRALELDPDSVSIRRSVAWAHYYSREFEAARQTLERAIQMNPTAEESHRILGLTLLRLGRNDEAVRVLRDALGLPGSGFYGRAILGYALGVSGAEAEARAHLAVLEEAATHEYVSPVALATLHIGLGQLQQALDHVVAAHRERRGWLAYLRVNAMCDPLRGDERFEALVRQMAFDSVSP